MDDFLGGDLWDVFQEQRMNDLDQRQDDLKGQSITLDHQVRNLRHQIARMALVNQALYELLKSRAGITDEDLRHKIREIDKRDGLENGKFQAGPVKCPKCGATVTAGALKCPSCGATIAPKYPFGE